ncbi:T6SS immunity protein Tdi1 domain-containing protein [Chitinimonas sp. JJ19]|uniref:T6SS immunity protein Tdi1 domain-containing protein n=1 Tax=Chitinimonas sp. JJ19 TaxID=3109352 RepID=UPI003003679C
MSILSAVEEAWGWTGIRPMELVGENAFGNLMLRDEGGCYWRLCPEDAYCEIVAANATELAALQLDQDFLHDWYMQALVNEARSLLGELDNGQKYCLKIPGVLGGLYDRTNLGTVPLLELIRFSGLLAYQIKDLPDGSTVNLTITA